MFRRPVLSVLLVVIGLLIVGLLGIGAFPPGVETRPVERTIPNDRFGTR